MFCPLFWCFLFCLTWCWGFRWTGYHSDCIRQKEVQSHCRLDWGFLGSSQKDLNHRKARVYETICVFDRSRLLVCSSFDSGPCVACLFILFDEVLSLHIWDDNYLLCSRIRLWRVYVKRRTHPNLPEPAGTCRNHSEPHGTYPEHLGTLTENQNNKNPIKVIKKQIKNNKNQIKISSFHIKKQDGTWLTECLPCQRSKYKVFLTRNQARVVQFSARAPTFL